MKKLVALLVATAGMIFLYGRIDYTAAPYNTWDLASYRAMAAAAPRLASDVCQPPAYRLLGPYLVGLLPVPETAGFYLVAIVASLALVLLAYALFRALGLTPLVATVTVILFAFNRFWFGLTVWDYFQINDLLSLVWIVIMFLAMMKDRWALFGGVLVLGVLTRETALLMAPVAFVYLWERKELAGKWRRFALAVIPGVVAFLLIRLLVPAPCGKSLFTQLAAHSRSILAPEKLFRLTINSYLPFSLLPLVFLGATVAFFRQRPHALVLVALVFLSTLFGLSYDERLMAPAFVAIYAVIGLSAQAVVGKRGQNRAFLAILLIGGFLASLHHQVARFPLPDRTWTLALSLGSLVIVTGAGIYYRIKSARAADSVETEGGPSDRPPRDLGKDH